MRSIYVKDYISLPCEDAAPGIAKAIAAAKAANAEILQFEAGVYPLCTASAHKTDQTAHDAGATYEEYKDVFMLLTDMENIAIRGAVDADGNPATVLEGKNDGTLHSILPSILWLDGGKNIIVENFKFRRNPAFCSAGKVTRIQGDTITVRVFGDSPCYDQMGTHCMNKFTPDGVLSGESLSYGPGLKQSFRLIGERTLSLQDADVAAKLAVGDIITFHQGARTDFQCFFGNVENLTLRNLHTTNANGFAHLAFHIHNLTAENIKFKPEGKQYFTAPRDAFKLHKCSGEISFNKLYIEGVRMDGQNMHSNYLFPIQILSENTVQFFSRYAYLPLKSGTEIEFYFGEEVLLRKIKTWTCDGSTVRDTYYGYLYTVTFETAIPDHTSTDTLCLARCWEPDMYTCTDSDFVNIAGAGHLARIDHMHIENCRYRHLMNSGILLGAEFPTHVEGGHATDITVKDCTFDDCGTTARYGAMGCIGIKSYGLPGKHNKSIRIENCSFKNSPIGIDAHDATDVHIQNCIFEQIGEKIRIEAETCGDITLE